MTTSAAGTRFTALELRVLQLLETSDERSQTKLKIAEELGEQLPAINSTMTHLRRAGLVTGSNHGRDVAYALTGIGESELTKVRRERNAR